MMIDIEMGGKSKNPMHEKKLVKENSESTFAKHVTDQTKIAAEKGLKAETNAMEAVNTDALGKLMGGGGVQLERLNIAINWAQNLGLVMIIDIPWPESFTKWFRWIEMIGFDFDAFGGMGTYVSIAMGLLVPVWLLLEFDAGLLYPRTFFGFAFMNKSGRVLTGRFLLAGILPVAALFLSCLNILMGWIANNLANAFILVISGLSLLSFLHQVYLWREIKVCELANEDFAKKRQENDMFFFLFFYTVSYLSGVSACTKLLVAESTADKVFGGVLMPFYVMCPLWMLTSAAQMAKNAVKLHAAESRGEKSYKQSLSVFRKKAVEAKINEVVTRSIERWQQRLPRLSFGL
ncbi:hypothetical protein TrVE_jg9157 [Triparma verrucosa]|uniref:Uncharacterized protein n=1 Tax=Triparma verrucosa TaxID=1606542 RepID=A0A9W7EYW3_9STRA|nr:hypothetical protein TrVE_jg9157 [Triparma verrucosa]